MIMKSAYLVAWILLLIIIWLRFVYRVNAIDAMPTETKKVVAPVWSERATLAWGCFWCIEAGIQEEPWVYSAISWFAWGKEENPTYDEVVTWRTWHREAVQIDFDPSVVSYERLLEIYFQSIDPSDEGGQFADRWFQYTTAIFYHTIEQKLIAEKVIKIVEASGIYPPPVVTEVLPYTTFYEAEEEHQDYYLKARARYKSYEAGSWRKRHIIEATQRFANEKVFEWDVEVDPKHVEAIESLTDEQYRVTQECWTEAPFQNEYRDHKEVWIYVDVVSWEALFSSFDKFDSGSGWPSFTQPLADENILEQRDTSHWMIRTEVKSSVWSHLWHVFEDGPQEHGWQRYCINSASLKFIPADQLEELGYWEWSHLFDE